MIKTPSVDILWFDPAAEAEEHARQSLLCGLGLAKEQPKLRDIARGGYPSFAGLLRLLPNFPVWIAPWFATKVQERSGGQLMDFQLAALHRFAFPTTDIGQAYYEAQREHAEASGGRPIALLILRANMIVHDLSLGQVGHCLTIFDKGRTVQVESLKNFARRLRAAGWKPGKAFTLKRPNTAEAPFNAGRRIPAAIVESCGTGAESCLLDLLVQLGTTVLPEELLDHVRIEADGTWAVLTQDALAQLTEQRWPGGYRLRSIQQGLACLEKKGLIQSRSGFAGRGSTIGYRPSGLAMALVTERNTNNQTEQTE